MLFFERIRTIALLCLSIFGCTGNILTLIIVNQRFFRKTPLSAFISGLSIADFIVLCLQSFQIVTKYQPHITSYDCIIFFLMDVFRLLSVWIVCFINLERCSLVFNPCHIPRLTSQMKSRIYVLILFLLSLIVFSHYGKHMHIKYVYNNNNQTNIIRSYCAYKPNFNRILWECIRSSLTYWITIPICIVCNIIIIIRLHQASRIDRALKTRLDLSIKQRQLTGMLVAASICFVLTSTPSIIHTIYLSIISNFTTTQYIIHIFTNILLHFHHASNFLVFMFCCKRFRLELMGLVHKYFRCQIYTNWYKRSIPNTEQIVVYSTKQQKTPVKLLTPKTTQTRRNTPHRIVVLATNNYCKKNGKNYRYCIPTYHK